MGSDTSSGGVMLKKIIFATIVTIFFVVFVGQLVDSHGTESGFTEKKKRK